MKNLITKTKKALIISTLSAFSVVAAANMVQQESAYILQGASKATMIELVKEVGGEMKHDFSVISAISANLTAEQVKALSEKNPLIRLSSDDKSKTAAIIWQKGGETGNGKGEKVAAIIWQKGGETGTKKGEKIAAIIWQKGGETGAGKGAKIA